jgi:branched-chain amino acid transport system ATP-binding protein
MLKIDKLDTYYGGLHILKNINMEVGDGETVCLIGANGAGKSTLLKAISGLVVPAAGTIQFNNVVLNKMNPRKIVEQGVTQVPEGRLVFAGLRVRENLELGAILRKDKSNVSKTYEEMYKLFPILKQRTNQDANTLSGGEQQMLAIARGLMANPKLILLDEPSLGLSPVMVELVSDIIQRIKGKISILLVEQNAAMALRISDRAYVLETGNITMQGAGQELLKNPAVRTAYLGL